MSNHLHVILRNRPDVVVGWSCEQVASLIESSSICLYCDGRLNNV